MGDTDRVTVEQALFSAETVQEVYLANTHACTLARFVLQEHGTQHSGDRETAEQLASRIKRPTLCPTCGGGGRSAPWAACSDPFHAEPPRPELPPARKGWVLTEEWRLARRGEWYWYELAQQPDLCNRDTTHSAHYILLKVPPPPGEGWVVTKYEEPQKGDLVWPTGETGWMAYNGGPLYGIGSYPDGRRFIAEQEDRAGEAERLARSLDSKRWEDPEERSWMVKMAANALALGVKAPDPVRLESL